MQDEPGWNMMTKWENPRAQKFKHAHHIIPVEPARKGALKNLVRRLKRQLKGKLRKFEGAGAESEKNF